MTAARDSVRPIESGGSRLDDLLLIDPIADWSFSHRSSLYRGDRGIALLPVLSRPTLNEPFEKTSELVPRLTEPARLTERLLSEGASFATLSFGGVLVEGGAHSMDPVTGQAVVPPCFLRVQNSIDDYTRPLTYPSETLLLTRYEQLKSRLSLSLHSQSLSEPLVSISLTISLCSVNLKERETCSSSQLLSSFNQLSCFSFGSIK
jgi:hypothetical protein